MRASQTWSAVLHGGWVLASGGAAAGFAIWGEESPTLRRPRSARPRKRLEHRPPPHQFALSDDGIRHALSMLGLTQWASQSNVRHVAACLPSTEAGPQRSGEPLPDGVEAHRVAWDVPAVVLDEVASVILLPRIAAAAA